MPATVHQLLPKPRQPEPESTPAMLRLLADQYEAEEVVGISVVVTGYDGKVSTHHGDEQPALTSRSR